MSIAQTLYRLQKVDSRLQQIETRLQTIQAALESNPVLQNAQQNLQQAKRQSEDVQKQLRQAEEASADQKIKIEQIESSLYSGRIQNPKELQDLQNDLASLKRRLASLEDAQLEQMLALEEARSQQAQAEAQWQKIRTLAMTENAALHGEANTLQKEAENLQTQRSAITPTLQDSQISLYENLRQNRRGLAVSTLSEGACYACGARLTPGQAQSVRLATQLILCPSCGRILSS